MAEISGSARPRPPVPKRGATASRPHTAAPASRTSRDSNTAHASPPGWYQSMNRLTNSRTAPTATSPVPASKRSRKGSLRLDRGRSAVKQTAARTGEVDRRIAVSGGQGEELEQPPDRLLVARDGQVA